MTGSTSMSLTLLPSAGLPGTILGPSGPLSCFVLIWMIRAYSSCKSKFQYIRIFPKINQRKDLQNRKVQVL